MKVEHTNKSLKKKIDFVQFSILLLNSFASYSNANYHKRIKHNRIISDSTCAS